MAVDVRAQRKGLSQDVHLAVHRFECHQNSRAAPPINQYSTKIAYNAVVASLACCIDTMSRSGLRKFMFV